MGSTYVSTIPLPIMLDNMIAKGVIPPVVVLFVDYPDGETQNRELSCDPKYGEFLAKELIPAQRDLLHATTDPKLITTGGASMSGLSAACLAFQHPNVFGNVISQSGSFWWSPANDLEDEWLTRQYAKHPKLPVLHVHWATGKRAGVQAWAAFDVAREPPLSRCPPGEGLSGRLPGDKCRPRSVELADNASGSFMALFTNRV